MPVAVDRRAEVTAVATGTGESWTFFVTVKTYSHVGDATVSSLARAEALAELERQGIEVSSLEVTHIEPMAD